MIVKTSDTHEPPSLYKSLKSKKVSAGLILALILPMKNIIIFTFFFSLSIFSQDQPTREIQNDPTTNFRGPAISVSETSQYPMSYHNYFTQMSRIMELQKQYTLKLNEITQNFIKMQNKIFMSNYSIEPPKEAVIVNDGDQKEEVIKEEVQIIEETVKEV